MATDSVHVSSRPWGIAPDGSAVECFALRNNTLELEILSLGARLRRLLAPDREGQQADVVLGYAGLPAYLEDKAFLGCTVARYANRIGGGRFTLDGTEYLLDQNDGNNTLHGGSDGLWHRNWQGSAVPEGMRFELTSAAGEQGFPGALTVVATYRLDGNRVLLDYEARSDAPTVVNLTNHAYFNLAGEGSPTVLDHLLQLEADAFTAIDSNAIPLGPQQPVAGSAFDFTAARSIGDRLHESDPQLVAGRGYDHNFVLRGESQGELRRAATAVDPSSGRRLVVETTEPGVQFYTGNYLDGTTVGKGGRPYGFRSAFCLETQHFPDSPNQPDYPSTVLRPGETFRSRTVWTLDTTG